jgi:uncharacterized protein (TIGR02996 family)
MPEEEAFLRTIRDRPTEDEPRLVYADWLEEHGETARAEFIRLFHQLQHIPRRLEELRQQVSPEWLAAVYNHWRVVLQSHQPDKMIQTIKLIREVTGLGLSQAKALAESLPKPVAAGVGREAAEAICARFTGVARAVIEPALEPAPPFHDTWPLPCWVTFLHRYDPREKIQTIKVIREVTGMDLWQSKNLAESPLPCVLKSGVTAAEAERIQRAFTPFATVVMEPLTRPPSEE